VSDGPGLVTHNMSQAAAITVHPIRYFALNLGTSVGISDVRARRDSLPNENGHKTDKDSRSEALGGEATARRAACACMRRRTQTPPVAWRLRSSTLRDRPRRAQPRRRRRRLGSRQRMPHSFDDDLRAAPSRPRAGPKGPVCRCRLMVAEAPRVVAHELRWWPLVGALCASVCVYGCGSHVSRAPSVRGVSSDAVDDALFAAIAHASPRSLRALGSYGGCRVVSPEPTTAGI
jgi:hypothetical protein